MAVDVGVNEAWSKNQLLSFLTNEDVVALQPHIQRVTLVLAQTLHEPGEVMDHVYFIEDGIVSMIADTQDNGSVEIGLTGREGMVGVSAVLNPDAIAVHRTVVQVAGTAIRMRTTALRDAVEQSTPFRDRCLRFAHYLLVQASQTAACNVRHELTERLARWLLISFDRIDGDELPMRQEFLALMLGVRRPGVSIVANTLQANGAIRQLRGRITLLDRDVLESEACSCYRFIENSRQRILGDDTGVK